VTDTAGSDTARFTNFNSPVAINLGLTSVQTITPGRLTFKFLTGSELETLYGSQFNDTLTGNANWNTIYGNDGDDVIDGSAGWDTIRGGNGNDVIAGGSGRDTIFGEAGSDSFHLLDGEIATVDGGGGTGDDTVLDKDTSPADVLNNI
jgi:Ca2+-binding RTX toxin-like protein